jgi:hypothetical protein
VSEVKNNAFRPNWLHQLMGQKHRFDGRLVTSGLAPTPDISLYSAN